MLRRPSCSDPWVASSWREISTRTLKARHYLRNNAPIAFTSVSADLSGSFTTHARYLRAFAQMMGYPPIASTDGARRTVADVARLVAQAYPPQPKTLDRDVDEDVLLQCLGRAWGTERLLGVSRTLSHGDEGLLHG